MKEQKTQKLSKNKEGKDLHYNIPQMLFYAVLARITICLWGRGTGKTEGPGALFTLHNNISMPRSLNGIITTTYEKVLTTVVPKLIKGWEKLNYYQDLHFVVRKTPPGHFKRAYKMPTKFEHYISWFNGSGNVLLSLDRPSLANGFDLDSLFGDEARFFKYDRIRDVILTVRGNGEHFGQMSCHGSILFCTDLPRTSEGKWLFEYAKLVEQNKVEALLKAQATVSKLQEEYDTATKKRQKQIIKQVDSFLDSINKIRKGLVYVSYASSLDNVHALGLDTLKQWKRTLTQLDYDISVLNKRIEQVENGFYGLLDDEIHGYEAGNFDHMDSLQLDFRSNVEKDCLWDNDLTAIEPLQFACDYNAAISNMVIGQEYGGEFKVQKHLFVKHPDRLKDLITKFDNYYSPHKIRNNTIIYHYDHTAVGTNASTDISYADEVIALLKEKGWNVIADYHGAATGHHSRYLFWGLLLKGDDPRLPKFRYNKSNCPDLEIAWQNTPVKQSEKGFKKDKSSERDANTPQEHATHSTEAADTLLWGSQRNKLRGTIEFMDIMTA